MALSLLNLIEFPETPKDQDIFHNSEWEIDKRGHILTFAGIRPV